jgi:D-glycero-alpha-D-manno-heptose 1-phosphate guanylyltransferase
MSPVDRYGTVCLGGARITGFREKAILPQGLINGGVYCVPHRLFERYPMPEKFSFEKEFLEAGASDIPLFGRPDDAWFIDIGVPDDYRRAQTEWHRMIRKE